MLAGPHPDCHSTVALHQIDGAPAARTAAPTARSEPDASRAKRKEGGGERGEPDAAMGRRLASGEARGGVLDGSHHVRRP